MSQFSCWKYIQQMKNYFETQLKILIKCFNEIFADTDF